MSTPKPLSGVTHHFGGFSIYHHKEPPFKGEPHAHAFLEIILPINPGHATVSWHHEIGIWHDQHIPSDQLCIVPPYQAHILNWHQTAELVLVYLNYSILLQVAQGFLPQYEIELFGHYGITDQLLQRLCLKLCDELQYKQSLELLYLEQLTTFLTVHLLRHYSSLQLRTYDHTLSGLVPYKLKQAISYMQSHCCQSDIRITDVAVEIGLSQYHFSRLFKQSMGMSPYKYLNQQRIERAKTLLKQKNTPISEIASEVGFGDQSHFTKHFRQITGVTPQAYRQTI